MNPQSLDTSAKTRILVVDDSRFIRKMISLLLAEQQDFEVVGAAADGEEGLKMARDLKPDVVTVDLDMPGMDGVAMMRALRCEQSLPIVVISSLPFVAEHDEWEPIGYVSKSISDQPLDLSLFAAELAEKIRETVARRQTGKV